jgi:hypothetical protein
LLDHKILFSNKNIEIRKYTQEAPFTADFSKQSPPRAIVWLGREIINEYMKNNPDIDFVRLMYETDYQKILNNSKYKP